MVFHILLLHHFFPKKVEVNLLGSLRVTKLSLPLLKRWWFLHFLAKPLGVFNASLNFCVTFTFFLPAFEFGCLQVCWRGKDHQCVKVLSLMPYIKYHLNSGKLDLPKLSFVSYCLVWLDCTAILACQCIARPNMQLKDSARWLHQWQQWHNK